MNLQNQSPEDVFLLLLEEDDDDENEYMQNQILAVIDDVFNKNIDGREQAEVLFNSDGSIRKRNRENYDRGPKRAKSLEPWVTCYWLQLIGDPLTEDPGSRNG